MTEERWLLADAAAFATREGAPWHVFAASGRPYWIAPRGGVRGAWVVRDWVRAAHDLEQNGQAWLSPLRARELLTSMGGVEPARMAYAATTLVFLFTRGYEYIRIGAGACMGTGLPVGADHLAERGPRGSLAITVRLDDASLPPDVAHPATEHEVARALAAAAAFTRLAIDDHVARQLRASDVYLADPITGNGTLYFELNRDVCQRLFGPRAYDGWWNYSK